MGNSAFYSSNVKKEDIFGNLQRLSGKLFAVLKLLAYFVMKSNGNNLKNKSALCQ